MTNWIVDALRTFDDIDGLGTPVAADDSITINNGGTAHNTSDWSGFDGSIAIKGITANAGGLLKIDPGASMKFNAAYIRAMQGGAVQAIGTSGSHITIDGVDATNPLYYLQTVYGGVILADYVDFGQYCGGGYSIFGPNTGGRCYGKHLTFASNAATATPWATAGTTVSGYCMIEDCTYDNYSVINYSLLNYGGTGEVVVKNCTLTNAKLFCFYNNYHSPFILVGTNTYDGSNMFDAGSHTVNGNIEIMDYQDATMNETEPVEGAEAMSRHPLEKEDGFLEWAYNDNVTLRYPSTWGNSAGSLTDSNGDKTIYELKRVKFHLTTHYFSDSSQAESGDNQKRIRWMSKSGYIRSSNDLKWAGQNSSFTLTQSDIAITNQLLTDYDISTSERTTAKCNVAGTPVIVTFYVNGHSFPMTYNADSGKYEATVYGWEIGACTNETVYFVASKNQLGDQDIAGSTLTVAISSMYAEFIKTNLQAIEQILQDSSRTYLAAVDNDHITTGKNISDDLTVTNQINVEPATDDIADYTVGTQSHDFKVSIAVVVKEFDPVEALDDLENLVGDIYDELMSHANRVLGNNCYLATVERTEFNFIPVGESGFLRWGLVNVGIDKSQSV